MFIILPLLFFIRHNVEISLNLAAIIIKLIHAFVYWSYPRVLYFENHFVPVGFSFSGLLYRLSSFSIII